MSLLLNEKFNHHVYLGEPKCLIKIGRAVHLRECLNRLTR